MLDPAATRAGRPGRPPRPLLRTMLGDVLRRTRLEQGRTLADVARAALVSMPYLSELERGRKEASSEVLAAICDALRIELADLLAEVRWDLAGGGARRAPVVRLDAIRPSRNAPERELDHPAAPADAPGRASGPANGLGRPQGRVGGSGDAVCLLAA